MKGSIHSSSSDEAAWEIRPSGMLVQKRDNDTSSNSTITIKVSYASQVFDLPVPTEFTFGEVKSILSSIIGLEPKVQKLLFRGKEKEDHEYLHLVGVKDNSKVLVMEEETVEDKIPEVVRVTTEISRGAEAVAEVRTEVDQLSEQVSAVQAVVFGGVNVENKDINFLTEMLMRQLLKLDGIEAEGEGKLQRKMEVRRVQSLVETMDAVKARNSNPFINSNAVSVTTQWETFETGAGSLDVPPPPRPVLGVENMNFAPPRPASGVGGPETPPPRPVLGVGNMNASPPSRPALGVGNMNASPPPRPVLGVEGLNTSPPRPVLAVGGLNAPPPPAPALVVGGLNASPPPRPALGVGGLNAPPPPTPALGVGGLDAPPPPTPVPGVGSLNAPPPGPAAGVGSLHLNAPPLRPPSTIVTEDWEKFE